MHPKFLNVLCCPKTYQPLHLESELVDSLGMVITGKLLTNDGISYPIIRGIPRFVDTEYYASSFCNVSNPMAGHTTLMNYIALHLLKPQIIFLEVLQGNTSKNIVVPLKALIGCIRGTKCFWQNC